MGTVGVIDDSCCEIASLTMPALSSTFFGLPGFGGVDEVKASEHEDEGASGTENPHSFIAERFSERPGDGMRRSTPDHGWR